MRRSRVWRGRVAIGALAVGLLAAGTAIGQQQQKPESILPPDFNEPAPAATPTPAPAPTPNAPAAGGPANILPDGGDGALDANTAEAADQPDEVNPALLAQAEMPDFAKRSLDITGIAGAAEGGLAPNAFGSANGLFLERLMGRLDAPIASRWLSIGLRRALASRLMTPAGLNGADFAAERTWLLVRMGEPIVARAVAQSVDTENATPKLYEASLQAALAAADPAGLCPLADGARQVSRDRGWVLATAFCAGLAGHPDQASQLIDQARRSGTATGIDLLLAEKVLGTGVQGRQAVTIEWDNVPQLTAWRYGLATATGVAIPAALFGTVNARVGLWRAQAPGLDIITRAPFADMAAAQGVLSSAALVDLYSEIDAGDDQTSAQAGVARDLHTAYMESDPTARLTVLRQLWDEPKNAEGRYARLILTARAAGAIPVASGSADSDRLIASMLSAGFDGAALRWKRAVVRGSDGWAMLALVDPSGEPLTRADVAAVQSHGTDPTGRKAAMFFAALAGLDRLAPGTTDELARTLDVNVKLDNSWTRAIDDAAARHQPGTVLLMSAVGMQTHDWHGVAPAALYRMVAAMHRVGLDHEARMIACEALTRL